MQPLNERVAWLQKELDALKAAGSDPAQMSRARAIEIAEEALGLLKSLPTPVEEYQYCGVCQHALHLHDDDGNCGCGMRCSEELCR